MDCTASLNRLADAVAARANGFAALHTVLLLALLLFTLPAMTESLRRASHRTRLSLVGLLGLAGVLRAVVIPALSRHVFDGHEADYYDVWRGAQSSVGEGYRASEWLAFLYDWGGPLFGGNGQALVVLQLLLSLVSLGLIWQWTRDLAGQDRAGLWAVGIVSLDPVLGFWASSAYNILLPFTCSLLALVAVERAIRRPSAAMLGLAGVAFAASVAGRPEALLVALPIAWRLLSHARRLLMVPRGLLALAAGLSLTAWPVLCGMKGLSGATSTDYMREMFAQQWYGLYWFTPWQHGWVLSGLAVLSVRVVRRLPGGLGLILMLVALITSHHLAYALFDDYDFRHTLLPRVAFVVWLVLGLEAVRGVERLVGLALALAVAGLLLLGLLDVRHRYYAGPEDFYRYESRLQTSPYVNLENYRGCIFVAEDLYYGRFARASHFELYTHRDWARLQERSSGCVLFVYDLENFQASSRSIDGRALKVSELYRLELLGKVIDKQAEHYSLVFRVLGRADEPLR